MVEDQERLVLCVAIVRVEKARLELLLIPTSEEVGDF